MAHKADYPSDRESAVPLYSFVGWASCHSTGNIRVFRVSFDLGFSIWGLFS